ncbi:MAG: TonB-dependent receptor [Bacteroidaceae bacterium]|nr:TonB-dependent receptor [Bacteroidaceae bacterium]
MNKKMKMATMVLLMAGIGQVTNAGGKAPIPKGGTVCGRVVDNEQQQSLPGASVYIEDLRTGVTSDINGFYTLPNLQPGVYTLKVSYVGYEPVEARLTVTEGKTLEYDIVMNEGVALQQVEVKSAFQGQRRAVNMQKTAMGVKNVVSADQVGKFPDANIGDALKRINGINVQYDMGEARFGQVRGTSADLTSVTVNGNRLPSAEGDTRNVQLDLIPADMVQTIEVSKVVTSDMDGDAIGGAINLVTKNTPYKRVLNATAGSGWNWVSDKMQLNLGLTYGDRYFNDKLGVMLAASYQNAPGGADNTEFEYDVDDDGNVYLDKAEIRQYYVTRERQSYSLAADYKFNPNHKLSFKGMYNRRGDWENRYRITYKKLNEKPEKQSLVLQTKGGSDDNRDARLELQQTMDFTLDGEHTFGKLKADWAASFSRATEERPNERYFGVEMKGKKNSDYFEDLSFVGAGGRHPYPNKGVGDISGYKWSIDELTNSNQDISEDEWKLRMNFELPLTTGEYASKLRFGGKYTDKSKQKEVHCHDYIAPYEEAGEEEWMNHMNGQIRSGFMVDGKLPIHTSFITKEYLGGLKMVSTQEGAYELYEEASGNYDATERISSAYLRLDQRLGRKWNAVVGLRMEHTSLNYQGFNWVVDDLEDEQGRMESTGHRKNDYTNWLPSLLVKYDATDDLKLRASFTKTLSRPKYSALVPCVHYNIAEEEASFGNARLKPTTSYNFDLGGEYYFEGVGLVSLGFFYKNVQDVIADEKWKSTSDPNIPAGLLNEDGEPVKYEITKPINAYDADLFGVEVAYQRDFGFIAPVLKCLGFYGTYTYTHSKTKNHHFEHRKLNDGEEIKMTGSPEHTANASLYYENKGLNVRLSYNFASEFVDEFGTVAALDRYYDKVNYLDLNASYTLGKKFKTTFYAEANNLLNQPLRYYQGDKERTMQVEYYGMRLNAGVKFQF